jgi:threonine/homoserine efflux transporter RhtA
MWGCTMIGPGEIGASTFNFLYFAWLGILGLLSSSRQDEKKNQTKIYLSIFLLFLIIADIFLELQDYKKEIGSGIFFALLGGTSSFIYFKLSQNFTKKTMLSATQILAVRFYFAILVVLILLPKQSVTTYLTLNNIIILTILAFCSLIIPLYFSQKALEKITPEQHAIINSLCPAATGILQEIIFKNLKLEQMFIYLLYSIAIALFYFASKSRKVVHNT